MTLAVTAVQVLYLGCSYRGLGAAAGVWMSDLMAVSIPATTLPLAFMRVAYPRLALDDADFTPSKFDAWGCF